MPCQKSKTCKKKIKVKIPSIIGEFRLLPYEPAIGLKFSLILTSDVTLKD